MKKALCGTPIEYCSGARLPTSQGIKAAVGKVHALPEEAFACHANYLVKILGYRRIGNREFEPPDGGPIRVLTRKSRFGGRLRAGKGGEGAAGAGKTVMPAFRHGGIIISK